MGIDLRRCAEAAAHAAFAEAFMRPAERPKRVRRRRFRRMRAVLRLMRILLMGVGLVTSVRVARDPELRRDTLEALVQRFRVEGLLEEIAVEVEAARAALADEAAASDQQPPAGKRKASGTRARRPVSRSRGDSNGQRGGKPPSRGTRAA
jgi:hypothetical protein